VSRFLRDSLWFAVGWAFYQVYTKLPWPMVRGEFGMSLLPMAGLYAYSNTWADFREAVQWNVDGRPRAAKGGEK
jgi:hypothetical protein